MAQRMMVFIYLHKRRKLAPANVFNPITTFLERASDRQMSNIGRQSGNFCAAVVSADLSQRQANLSLWNSRPAPYGASLFFFFAGFAASWTNFVTRANSF